MSGEPASPSSGWGAPLRSHQPAVTSRFLMPPMAGVCLSRTRWRGQFKGPAGPPRSGAQASVLLATEPPIGGPLTLLRIIVRQTFYRYWK